MNRLREELESPDPSLAAIFSQYLEEYEISAALNRANVAEFRADRFSYSSPESHKQQICKLAKLPVLLTVRSADEGGNWGRSEEERADLIEELLPAVDGVDIELSADMINEQVIKAAHDLGLIVVASMHAIERMPDEVELIDTLRKANELSVDYTKLAVTTGSREDFRDLIAFASENSGENLIISDMGIYGGLLLPTLYELGSKLGYAYAGSNPTAPGQLSISEARALINTLLPKQ